MTDTKSSNFRLSCYFCKEEFLFKTYSKHLIDKHLSEIFVNKHNKKELDDLCAKKEGSWFSSIELKINGKELYLASCCNKFYSKKSMADKHSKNKECRDTYLKNAKELCAKIAPITINNTHSGSGDIIINNTYNILDLSGNIIKTFKALNQKLDRKNVDGAYDKKLIAKLQKQREKEGLDPVSDVSTVSTCYDSNDECDTNALRYDISRDMPSIHKSFIKYGFDLSREGLDLPTKEEHDNKKREQRQYDIEELEDNIVECKGVIYSSKEDIEAWEERIRDAEDEDKIYYFKKQLAQSQKYLDNARREKDKYEEELKELKSR
jgi:hypothetical protein